MSGSTWSDGKWKEVSGIFPYPAFELIRAGETEMPGWLQAQFSERGIRMTGQRRAILRVMETASKQLDASQILRKAQKLDPSVDRSGLSHPATAEASWAD